jgi:peptidoglycan/xylan/chitin deacetylase (PgdA/CDA1 family)
LATLKTDAELDAAFGKLEAIYQKVLGPTAPVITTIRAPFGSPFQLNPNDTKRVAPVVTKYGVEIGWGMDPKDWTFDHFSKDAKIFNADVQAVIDSVQTLINNKQWGLILLHAVHLPSATALPTVIKMFRDAGYHFVSVEDVVRAEFGANSASIMAANKAAGLTAGATH